MIFIQVDKLDIVGKKTRVSCQRKIKAQYLSRFYPTFLILMDSGNTQKTRGSFNWCLYLTIGAIAIILWWFYFNLTAYGMKRMSTVASWMHYQLNHESNDMQHAWLVPILSGVMLYHVRDRLSAAVKKIDWKGLLLVAAGAFIYLVAYRVIQVRFAVIALPVIILGCIWYLSGFETAKISAIPILFLWMMVPLFSFQQATNNLQIIATQMGHYGAMLFGVETITQGTSIFSAGENWDAYSIAGGCSGMRSLMALLMISIVWAYMANLPVWKKLLLIACSIPLAVLGNAFRITSIFVLAEYLSPSFASREWHDWSGLLFFFPITLSGLMFIHSLLAGEIPWLKKNRKKVVIRKNTTATPVSAPHPDNNEEQ